MNPEVEARMAEDDLGGVRYWDENATFLEGAQWPKGVIAMMTERQMALNRDLEKQLLFSLLYGERVVRFTIEHRPNKLLLLCGPSL